MATAEMDDPAIAVPPWLPRCDLILGDARRLPLADRSVHCVVTSIPYWGLRDYGVGGQIGMEPTPADYTRAIVAAFGKVWRVLRDDGTLWLNVGDTYVTKPMGKGTTFDPKYPGGRNRKEGLRANRSNRPSKLGLKHKDLVGIPWRVALALQDAGWYLRCDIIWNKPNAFCESVRDRPARSHEYLFLLSKRPRYYFDIDAIREPHSDVSRARVARGHHRPGHKWENGPGGQTIYNDLTNALHPGGRNKRSVWTINTQPLKQAHFATYPRRLVEPCILAGTSAAGCCPACAKPWRRVVERPTHPRAGEVLTSGRDGGLTAQDGLERTGLSHFKYNEWLKANPPQTVGWEPACGCDAGEPGPSTVLDPFNGAGTTGLVALALGRSYIGVDLKPEYLAMSRERIAAALAAPPRRPRKRRRPPRPEQRSLFPDEP